MSKIIGCCKNGALFCQYNWNCPNAPIDLRPLALPWGQRFSDVPAASATPYRGQIFAGGEATALEFVAFLFDRGLLSEWPTAPREAVSATGFEKWFSAGEILYACDDEAAEAETAPTPA